MREFCHFFICVLPFILFGSVAQATSSPCFLFSVFYDTGNPKMLTLCGCGEHRANFHYPCLLLYLQKKKTCPVCNQELFYQVSNYLFINLFVCLFVYLIIYLPIFYLFIHLRVCLHFKFFSILLSISELLSFCRQIGFCLN